MRVRREVPSPSSTGRRSISDVESWEGFDTNVIRTKYMKYLKPQNSEPQRTEEEEDGDKDEDDKYVGCRLVVRVKGYRSPTEGVVGYNGGTHPNPNPKGYRSPTDGGLWGT